MSSSRRGALRAGAALGLLVLLPGALLSGCGFRPLYGQHGATAGVSEKLDRVAIANIPDRSGQILRNLLIDRFHFAEGGPARLYRLDASILATEQKLALRQDASAERAQLILNVPFRLIENATGRTLFEGSSRAFVPYNVLEERFAGLTTLDHAYTRGLTEISDEITARVAMYLSKEQ